MRIYKKNGLVYQDFKSFEGGEIPPTGNRVNFGHSRGGILEREAYYRGGFFTKSNDKDVPGESGKSSHFSKFIAPQI